MSQALVPYSPPPGVDEATRWGSDPYGAMYAAAKARRERMAGPRFEPRPWASDMTRLQLVSAIKRELKALEPPAPPDHPPRISIALIRRVCCETFGVGFDEFDSSHRRTPRIVEARHVAMYLSRHMTRKSLLEIGRLLDRDHTTILHAVRKMTELLAENPPSLTASVHRIRATIEGTMGRFIFVFGSNLAGKHGKGSALEARQRHGAIVGQGRGIQGSSYAIPTKGYRLESLPLATIATEVQDFLYYALDNKNDKFHVVAIGCGLAGYSPEQIAPMFQNAPPNVILPPEFKSVLEGRKS